MPVECLGVGSFLTKLWVYITAPLIVVVAAFLFIVLSSMISSTRAAAAERRDRNGRGDAKTSNSQAGVAPPRPGGHLLHRQRPVRLEAKQRATRDSAEASDSVRLVPQLKKALLRAAPLCLFIAFLSMPSVTSLAARSFLYQCFDQDSCYLEADYAVHVGEAVDGSDYLGYNNLDWATVTPRWNRIRRTAWLGLALYPLGQVVVFAVLLRSCRRVILNRHRSDLTQAVAFLFSVRGGPSNSRPSHYAAAALMILTFDPRYLQDFKPEFYAFELVLMTTKICLVGFATMVTPAGSIIQVVFGLLVALFQLVVLATTQPYKRRINNTMGVGCSLVLVNVFLACLQIKVRDLVATVPGEVSTLLRPLYNM